MMVSALVVAMQVVVPRAWKEPLEVEEMPAACLAWGRVLFASCQPTS